MMTLEQQQAGGPVLYGPLLEQGMLSAGLDYYKPTMSQLHYTKHPDVDVTFTFKNRGQERLADYVEPKDLQQRLDWLQQNGWRQDEIDYFAGLKNITGERIFTADFLDYLQTNGLPPIEVGWNEERNDLAVEVTGPSPLVTFWETVVMSEINELYFENFVTKNNLNLREVYEEGDRRLSEKIAILQQNPGIKFADFGTRRHFSLRWQKHVVERLAVECPENFVGTSNVALAYTENLKPIGTFAHELPMIYAGIADAMGKDVRGSHHEMLEDWFDRYGVELSTALTDTFGSEFFFADFTQAQAEHWKGVRHDSGDPVAFGEHFIEFLEEKGIDPTTKTICFSDGLDLATIVELHKHFEGRVGVVFGWGTALTNDLGPKALNIVMKATHVRLPDGREADLVKLSDNEGKHTGPEAKIRKYQRVFGQLATAA
jgi:nicotinate phosphoribosyltransferase